MDTFPLDLLIYVKSLVDYTNVFSPNDYGKNDKIILKYFPLKIQNYFKNMAEENISQYLRLKNIDETRLILEEIKQNELMSKKHKKVCTTLNYTEHFLILASTITQC